MPWRSCPVPDLRQDALRYLARRDYSRATLAEKLQTRHLDVSPDAINEVLCRLEGENILSDERFATEKSKARSTRYGNRHLRHELQKHGVEDDLIHAALSTLTEESARCRLLYEQRFQRFPDKVPDPKKVMRYLSYRGFSAESIRIALSEKAGENE